MISTSNAFAIENHFDDAPFEWQNTLLTASHVLCYPLHALIRFNAQGTMRTPTDVTKTHNVNSVWLIVSTKFLTAWKLVTYHYSDVICPSWRSKSPATPQFVQSFVQVDIRENIKATHYWSFARGNHQWSAHSSHNEPVTRKPFPRDDVIMYFLHVANFIVTN